MLTPFNLNRPPPSISYPVLLPIFPKLLPDIEAYVEINFCLSQSPSGPVSMYILPPCCIMTAAASPSTYPPGDMG